MKIEEVTWKDAQIVVGEKFKPGLPVKKTIGYTVYEDAEELALASEVHPAVPDFMQEAMDHTKIPKVLIVSRRVVVERRVRKGKPNDTQEGSS